MPNETYGSLLLTEKVITSIKKILKKHTIVKAIHCLFHSEYKIQIDRENLFRMIFTQYNSLYSIVRYNFRRVKRYTT